MKRESCSIFAVVTSHVTKIIFLIISSIDCLIIVPLVGLSELQKCFGLSVWASTICIL